MFKSVLILIFLLGIEKGLSQITCTNGKRMQCDAKDCGKVNVCLSKPQTPEKPDDKDPQNPDDKDPQNPDDKDPQNPDDKDTGKPETEKFMLINDLFGVNDIINYATDPTGIAMECPASQPYCRIVKGGNDFCSSKIDLTNKACSATVPAAFSCTGNGIFPDPSNCGTYHICDVDTPATDTQTCPDKNRFNTKTNKCERYSSNAQCYTMTCSKDSLGFKAWQPDNKYYTACLDDKEAIQIWKCADKEIYTDDSGCWFSCPGKGRYPHESPKKYYECDGGRGDYTVETCPGKFVFDPKTKQCKWST